MTSRSGDRAARFALPLALTLALCAPLLAPSSATAEERFAYRSEIGRFSVDFPAASLSVDELTGPKFTITDNNLRHTVFVDEAEFVVEIHDIPRLAEILLTSHYVLERAAEGMLEDIGGRELDSAEASVQEQPAREVAFEIPDRAIEGRLLSVLVGRRLYLVSVRYPQSIEAPEASAPFFESFLFWLE